MPRRPEPRTALLVELLDSVFEGPAWHGTTLRGSVRGLTARQAQWRPGPRRHSAWELVLHTAYWKYVTRRRLTNGRKGAFPRRGGNWPQLPRVRDDAAWREDVALLVREHRALVETVAAFPAARLARRPATGRWTFAQQVHGVAAHDAYHAGQIQLVKRLRGEG